MAKSNIEWTEKTWNPVTGCNKISTGCKNCYAEVMAKRLQAMGTKGYENGFEVTLHPERLEQPYKWKKPSMVFVNSMSDLFHEDVPTEFILSVLEAVIKNPQHIFQILTKRPESIVFRGFLDWNILKADNVWLGVTVENNKTIDRIEKLKDIPAKTKFISCEPLLGYLGIVDLTGIDWVICGAESGHNARPMYLDYAYNLLAKCRGHNIPFFMKQICKNGRKIAFDDFPDDLKIREYPEVK